MANIKKLEGKKRDLLQNHSFQRNRYAGPPGATLQDMEA